MATATLPQSTSQRLVLSDVSWTTYRRLLKVFENQRGVRLTYDRGVLEILSPYFEHETNGYFLGRLVVALTEELGLPIRGGGSTTLRRRRMRRGLEPDHCFWIANEPRIRSNLHIDLRVDPPPDLALEVDLTNSSLNRLSIYAALGVPEVWRLDHQTLTFFVLGSNRTYSPASRSQSFPNITPADLTPWLTSRGTSDDNTIIARFRAWLHQQSAQRGSSTTP